MAKRMSNILNMLAGDVFKTRFVRRQIWLMLLICLMCIGLVQVRYNVEGLTKEKLALEEEIDFLREQRIQKQKQYQESIRISRLDVVLDTIGVGLMAAPPYELKRGKEQ